MRQMFQWPAGILPNRETVFLLRYNRDLGAYGDVRNQWYAMLLYDTLV